MSAPVQVIREVRLPEEPNLGKASALKRKEAVEEAISWRSGPGQESRVFTTCYVLGEYAIVAGKPGKEAAPDYVRCKRKDGSKGNNKNDMKPLLLVDEQPHSNAFSFDDIFMMLETINKESPYALGLLAHLMYRMAYMLDHDRNGSDGWRLRIPDQTIAEIESKIPAVEGIPIRVFLLVADVISLNEDVKYHTLGYNDNLKAGTGRRNNLLTYVNLCGVFLHGVPFSKFAYQLSRPPTGVAPISKKSACEVFPMLLADGD